MDDVIGKQFFALIKNLKISRKFSFCGHLRWNSRRNVYGNLEILEEKN